MKILCKNMGVAKKIDKALDEYNKECEKCESVDDMALNEYPGKGIIVYITAGLRESVTRGICEHSTGLQEGRDYTIDE